MKKLRLIAVQSQKKALLEDLLKLGCVEVTEPELGEDDILSSLRDKSDEGAMERRSQQLKILNALKVLDQYAPAKRGMLSPKPEEVKENFLDKQGLEQALDAADRILRLDGELRAVSANESRERALEESLKPWQNLDLPLECRGTRTCDLLLGAVPASVSQQEAEGALIELDADLTQIEQDKTDSYVVVLYRKEIRDEVLAALREVNFSQISLGNLTGTAKENIALCQQHLRSKPRAVCGPSWRWARTMPAPASPFVKPRKSCATPKR